MKRFKLLAIAGAVLVILTVLAGCASLTVVGVDSVTGPKQVRQYGTISSADVTVNAVYKDGSTKQAGLTRDSVSFDSSKTGTQTVTVKVSGSVSATFEVEVMPLTGITVTAQPNPSTLKLGVAVDSKWPGLEIQGAWDKMGSEKINVAECKFSGFDVNKAGGQTVTVEWKGKQATFNVNVVAMESMRIASNPTRVSYIQGESLVLTGMKVMGTWPGIGESDLNITASNITGYNANTVGRQTVTVTVDGKTATFTVEVTAPIPATLADFIGTWVCTYGDGGFRYIITETEVVDIRPAGESKLTITAVTPIQNTNNSSKADYPTGIEYSYMVMGTERKAQLFMHNNRSRLIDGLSGPSTPYVKQ
ncbi:MAG: bacterial Ig-like domain-containing protein [Treponema sp.]|jgi:hypothetical protein|nr:bacterial Ig-like domain-containing protein [Treponema sp.]